MGSGDPTGLAEKPEPKKADDAQGILFATVDGHQFYIHETGDVSIDDVPMDYHPGRIDFGGKIWTAKELFEESIHQQEMAARGARTFTSPLNGKVILNSTPELRADHIRAAHNVKVLQVMHNIKGGPFAAVGALGGLLEGDVDRALAGSSVGSVLDAGTGMAGGTEPFSGPGQRVREWGGVGASGGEKRPATTMPLQGPRPKIEAGKQGKHIPGHKNYRSGRSVLTADAEELAKAAGTGQQVGRTEVGMPGSKERVVYEGVIGRYVDEAGHEVNTSVGIIHYSRSGIHIVPGRPQ